MVEGKEVAVGGKVVIDTSNILFIAGGAFVGMMDIVQRQIKASSFGFKAKETIDMEVAYRNVNTANLIEYGMIPEFIGRFPVITYTNDLTKQEIIEVIKSTDNSILKQYKKLFSINDELDLDITHPAIEEISEMVIRDKIGVRGVRKVVENILHTVQRNAETIKKEGGHRVIINKDVIMNAASPVIEDVEGKELVSKKYKI